jgi:curved DNA-binding protein CbpA
MLEEVALDDALKRLILELETNLGRVDHFTLLGVPPDSDRQTVKAAYFELCRRIHPDRHFRKRLGSFKARIDKVFHALRTAQQTLTDPAKREEYLDANPTLRRRELPKWKPGKRIMFNKNDFPGLDEALKKGSW